MFDILLIIMTTTQPHLTNARIERIELCARHNMARGVLRRLAHDIIIILQYTLDDVSYYFIRVPSNFETRGNLFRGSIYTPCVYYNIYIKYDDNNMISSSKTIARHRRRRHKWRSIYGGALTRQIIFAFRLVSSRLLYYNKSFRNGWRDETVGKHTGNRTRLFFSVFFRKWTRVVNRQQK